ncbi:MAG: hypothetical protein JWN70_1963 [Planctomycetaceae bacterium]|nr:hypothetical protein [Planctomycetaceae bacterium]
MSAGSFTLPSRILICALLCLITSSLSATQFVLDAQNVDLEPGAAPARQKKKGADERPILPTDVDVDPFWLGTIKHRSLGVRDVESEAYYKVLDHARKTQYVLQKKVAAENVARHEKHFREQPETARRKFSLFTDVFTHPEEYTGELLTLKGYVRKNHKHPADADDPSQIPTYEAWLYTPDSQHNPVVVVYTDLPKGMPVGGSLVETVEVTGYFFKVYGYRAQDGLRAAPMLLAKTFDWTPKVVRDTTAERVVYFLITGALVCGLVFVFWKMNQRQHARLSKQAAEPEDFDPRDLQSLDLESLAADKRGNESGV